MSMTRRELRRAADRERMRDHKSQWEAHCIQLPRERWPLSIPPRLAEVWISQRFLVQVYEPDALGRQRMSVNRVTLEAASERWTGGITWEELQRLKKEVGRGEKWAVEIFPADEHVVNITNMRHLWLLPTPPDFGWHRKPRQ